MATGSSRLKENLTMQTQLLRCAALTFTLAIFSHVAFGAPAAVVDETAFDFGYVPQQAKISHIFTIRSTGDDTLKITQVIPGCGCTKTPLQKSEIAPGDSTTLEVVFSTGAYTGRVVKHPKFLTNEGSSDHRLQFLSHVVTRPDSTYPLIVQPAILDFSSAGGTPPTDLKVRVINVSDTELGLSLIETPEGSFTVALPDKIPAGGSAEAIVRLADSAPPSFEKSFTFQLNDAQTSRFTVPVKRTGGTTVSSAD